MYVCIYLESLVSLFPSRSHDCLSLCQRLYSRNRPPLPSLSLLYVCLYVLSVIDSLTLCLSLARSRTLSFNRHIWLNGLPTPSNASKPKFVFTFSISRNGPWDISILWGCTVFLIEDKLEFRTTRQASSMYSTYKVFACSISLSRSLSLPRQVLREREGESERLTKQDGPLASSSNVDRPQAPQFTINLCACVRVSKNFWTNLSVRRYVRVQV
jgi:hypothetical protein